MDSLIKKNLCPVLVSAGRGQIHSCDGKTSKTNVSVVVKATVAVLTNGGDVKPESVVDNATDLIVCLRGANTDIEM